jgi:hypothetical protein
MSFRDAFDTALHDQDVQTNQDYNLLFDGASGTAT